MKPIFAHIIAPNLGDKLCTPKLYFPKWRDCEEVDLKQMPRRGEQPVVIGGGGMLHPGWDQTIMETAYVRKVICWGIGLNYHEPDPTRHRRQYLRPCRLVGLRDLSPRITGSSNWAPCPSCMAPEINTFAWTGPKTGSRIAYTHPSAPIGLPGVEEFTNHPDDTPSLFDFFKRIEKFEVVITNSFHGALWAGLSGRRVILWKPFADRFKTALPPLPVATTEAEVADHCKNSPQVRINLARHRQATRNFCHLVEQRLAKWGCE